MRNTNPAMVSIKAQGGQPMIDNLTSKQMSGHSTNKNVLKSKSATLG